MSNLTKWFEPVRVRLSKNTRTDTTEEFYSDKSRILFCSSFRRLMQKAQVYSLEVNSTVRNRLTHSLEVADVGRTLARKVGHLLVEKKLLDPSEIETLQTIVENACLLHDLGNTPFGHFGESAIKKWFAKEGQATLQSLLKSGDTADYLEDFRNYDGNPQGFRIVVKLHNEMDQYGLNLTAPTLLAAIKYPFAGTPDTNCLFSKKIGVFRTEQLIYENLCKQLGHPVGQRFFLAYLMELADDICYCSSDIADSLQKGVITNAEFCAEYPKIAKEQNGEAFNPLPQGGKLAHFNTEVSIKLTRQIIEQSAQYFVEHFDDYLAGKGPSLAETTDAGKCLEVLKVFCRRYVYTSPEAQRMEIAGSTIMSGLLSHFAKLLSISRTDFLHFIEKKEMRHKSDLDLEWRIYNQLSKRMVKCYAHFQNGVSDAEEWRLRAHLIVDFVSSLTDATARDIYQNLMGINL